MLDRPSYDLPAVGITLVIGLLVIAVALPFTIQAFPDRPKAYDAIWGNRTSDQKALTVAGETGSYTATVTGTLIQPSAISVAPTGCVDTHDTAVQYGQKPANLAYRLSETRRGNTTVLKEGTFTCATQAGAAFIIPLGPHFDVAGAEARNETTASKIVWLEARKQNETVSYTLTVTPSRPPATSPGGLPVPVPNAPATRLTAGLSLTLSEWHATLRLDPKEVAK